MFRSLTSIVSALWGVVANSQQTMHPCCPPPRRTVHADFPHTALRQSLAARNSRGVVDVQHLQIQEAISFQSGVHALTLSEGFATSLAPIQHKSLKPTSYKMVHIPKHFPRIPITEVVRPASEDYIDFFNDLFEGLLIPAEGLISGLVSETGYGLPGWKDIQVLLISSLQVSVIPESKAQEIQRLSPSPHSHDVRLVPVYFKPKVPFQLLLYPFSDAWPHISSQDNKIVSVSDQSSFCHLIGAIVCLMKGPIQLMEVNIGQQRRDNTPLGRTLSGCLPTALAIFFHHRAAKPHSDQLQHRSIRNPFLNHSHQLVMGNAVKIAGKIRIIYLPPTLVEVLSDLIHGSVSSSPGSKAMGAVHEVCFKDRLNDKQNSHLYHPVPHTRNSKGALLAVCLGDIDTAHRSRTINLGTQFPVNLIKKCVNSSFSFLYAADGYSIHSRCPLIGSYSSPRCFQYIPSKYSIIQDVEPELTFSFGLAAQFPSQERDLNRHPGFRLEPFCHPFRDGALSAQAVSFSLDRIMTEVRPLCSIPFPGLPRYYGPLRLPTVAVSQVIDSLRALSTSPDANTTSGLPGSSTDLSAHALLNHPGRPSRCFRSLLPRRWQASPSLEGWPPPYKRNEAESGSLSLGLTPSLSRKYYPLSPLTINCRDRPTPRVRLPSTGDRNYMLNEQLTCMTHFSHIDQPDLSWRTRAHRATELFVQIF